MDDILKDYNNVVQLWKDPCVPELVLHSGILIDSLVFATPRLEWLMVVCCDDQVKVNLRMTRTIRYVI